jgi:hypothetical protein
VYAIVALPPPDAGVIPVIHGASLVAVQAHDAARPVLNGPPAAGTVCVGGVSVYEHPADCVTVSWTLPPAPWTVT